MASTHGANIALVITDVMLPETNGKALVDAITASHPTIKHLFMSGYTSDVLARKEVWDEKTHFISKPFTPHRYSRKIRQIIDRD